jgi:hypothetical protein
VGGNGGGSMGESGGVPCIEELAFSSVVICTNELLLYFDDALFYRFHA